MYCHIQMKANTFLLFLRQVFLVVCLCFVGGAVVVNAVEVV